MTGLDRDTSESPDRTGVCCTGRGAPSQCETITGPGFSSLNKPDQERTPAYRDSSGSESPSGCLLCYFVRRLGGAIWGIPDKMFRLPGVRAPERLHRFVFARPVDRCRRGCKLTQAVGAAFVGQPRPRRRITDTNQLLLHGAALQILPDDCAIRLDDRSES